MKSKISIPIRFSLLVVLLICNRAFAQFTVTGSMTTARLLHTATLLPNGKVLIAGGGGNSGPISSAELYDPATGIFSATGSMTIARQGHTATLLPNGKVLIAGGESCGGCQLSSAELYDPATGTFTATGGMVNARETHTATLLGNGKVLVAGGDVGPLCQTPLSSAELYDPAMGNFTSTGSMINARFQAAATILTSGKVLVAGGGRASCGGAWGSAELYDPVTGTFSSTGDMNSGRFSFTLTLLGAGKVLAAGGSTGPSLTSSADLYDPTAGTFAATASMSTSRTSHTATLLANGQVLVAGGTSDAVEAVSSAERYDATSGTFTAAGTMTAARTQQTATVLNNGQVLIAGGNGGAGAIASAELYGPLYDICALYDQTRSVHSGAIFPIKVALCDANGNDLSSSSIVLHATAVTMLSTVVGAPESPGNANPDSDFRFDSTLGTTGGYIFNLSTIGLASGTYSLQFTATGDPVTHSVYFGVK
jgi:galactose oxidase-like protein